MIWAKARGASRPNAGIGDSCVGGWAHEMALIPDVLNKLDWPASLERGIAVTFKVMWSGGWREEKSGPQERDTCPLL